MEVHEIKAPATVLAAAVLAHEPVEPALEPARQIEIGGAIVSTSASSITPA